MMNTAERNRELVAHFATERTRLRRAKMMGIRWLPPANQASLRGDELTMCFVADAPRFADRKRAYVDAATDAGARVVVGLAGGLSRIGSVLPRTRCGDMGQHRGGSRWGAGVQKARLYPWPAFDRFPQPVSGPPIAECCEPRPEACFDKAGVIGRQRVLSGQAPMCQLAASSAD
jgi:hypothetical protein